VTLFDDRLDAAKRLAERLKAWLHNYMCLAIPRGGVTVVGEVILSILGVKLDIIIQD
jgi:predicted phosphoribosyltransferase